MEDRIYTALHNCYLLLTGQAFEGSKKEPCEISQEIINDLSDVLENYEDTLHESLSNLTDREEVGAVEDGTICPFCLVTVERGCCLCPSYDGGDDFLQRS
jgi:hypothetical protein